MTGTMRGLRTMETGTGTLLKLAMLAGVLAILPAALRVLTPVVLAIAEILLGVGQACVTFLRTGGF